MTNERKRKRASKEIPTRTPGEPIAYVSRSNPAADQIFGSVTPQMVAEAGNLNQTFAPANPEIVTLVAPVSVKESAYTDLRTSVLTETNLHIQNEPPVYTDQKPKKALQKSVYTDLQALTQPRLKQTKTKPSAPYRKDSEQGVYFYFDRNGLAKMKKVAAAMGISLKEFVYTAAIEKAESLSIQTLNINPGLHRQTSSGLHIPDDMMIYKTHEDIIMHYERLSRQTWTPRDDRIGQNYNDVDIRIIEIALIATIEKKLRGNTAKQPIKSFNYFTQEIDLLIAQQKDKTLPTNLDEYHKYVVSTWDKRIKQQRDEKWAKPNL